MADDHSAAAISAYGSKVNQTPKLDRLASEGMRFDRVFCVNAICSPSRATILTGKCSHLNGVPTFNRFDGSQPTLAKLKAELCRQKKEVKDDDQFASQQPPPGAD